jgi:hypothetical protein
MASIVSIFLPPKNDVFKGTSFDLASQRGPEIQVEPGKPYAALPSGFEGRPRKLGKVRGGLR